MILHLYKIFEEEFPNPMICILTNRVTKNVKNLFLSIYHMGFKNSTFLSQYVPLYIYIYILYIIYIENKRAFKVIFGIYERCIGWYI